MLKGKRILLGITGGIAAYKIASLIRILIKEEAEVKCIMTPASCDFISPLTISTLSKNDVGIDFWNRDNGKWTNHVDLGMWGDIFVIAPLTANSLSKMANGGCDNLLLATYLSAKCPVMIAPAMDLDMYTHDTTTENLATLHKHGIEIIDSESGELASGLVGKGRMAEPENIADRIKAFFNKQETLKGQKVLITAGPTYEQIDPVRFIGNHSTGKMGFAIAKNVLDRGGEVVMIAGPTKIDFTHPRMLRIDVKSADEMLAATQANWNTCTGGVFTAAVADYKPKNKADQKIKKKEDEMSITLVKNPDILKWAGGIKSDSQWLMGFALETNNGKVNAQGKLAKKNLDAIVLNTLEDKGAGFGHDTNKITIFDKHNNSFDFKLRTKTEVADDICNYLIENIL